MENKNQNDSKSNENLNQSWNAPENREQHYAATHRDDDDDDEDNEEESDEELTDWGSTDPLDSPGQLPDPMDPSGPGSAV